MDALAAKYAREVNFVLVYGYEAHPERLSTYGIRGDERKLVRDATTISERRDLAEDFRSYYHLQRPIVVDDFNEGSAAWRLLGTIHFKHPLVILDALGKVIQRLDCPNSAEVDQCLGSLLIKTRR
jgi:hypothetical protein